MLVQVFEKHDKINFKKHHESFPKKDEINIAILRNPYTRLQSIFSHIKERSDNNRIRNQLGSEDLKDFNTLDELCGAFYDKNRKNHKQAIKLLKWDNNKINEYRNNIYKINGGCPIEKKTGSYSKLLGCIHWAPQYLYLNNDNYIEYLLKFENLDKEGKRIKKKILNRNIQKHRKSMYKYKKKTKITNNVEKLLLLLFIIILFSDSSTINKK